MAIFLCLFISCSQDSSSEDYKYFSENTYISNLFSEIHKKNPVIKNFLPSSKSPSTEFTIYKCPTSRLEGKMHSPFSVDILFWVEGETLYYYAKEKIKFQENHIYDFGPIIKFYDISDSLEYIDLSGFDLTINDKEKFSDPEFKYFPKYSAITFGGCTSLKNIEFGKNKKIFVNYKGLFSGCSSLEEIDLSFFDTDFDISYFSSMESMFAGCSSLKEIDLSCINDSSKVISMENMFSGCTSLKEINLSYLNTSNVTSMKYMFEACASLEEIDFSNFSTSSCEEMTGMFRDCIALENVDISKFETNNVKTNESLSGFRYMFKGCSSLKELDVSSFEIADGSDCREMFADCTELTTIYAKPGTDWDGYNYETKSYRIKNTDIFANCISLVGGKGTSYANDKIVTGRTRIDGLDDGTGFTRGYFTEKQ